MIVTLLTLITARYTVIDDENNFYTIDQHYFPSRYSDCEVEMKNKWRLLIIITIVLVLVCLITGCNQSFYDYRLNSDFYEGYNRGYIAGFQEGQKYILDWKVFTDGYTYFILLPPDWSARDGLSGITFYESPKDSAYIAISLDNYDSVDESISSHINFTKEDGTFLELLSDNNTKHHGLEARVVEYTWQGKLPLHTENVMYVKLLVVKAGNKLFDVYFCIYQSQLSSYEEIIDEILDSFIPLRELKTT